MRWVIMDDSHSEEIGNFASQEAALWELKRLAALPWDGLENRAPCTSWRTCSRCYVIRRTDANLYDERTAAFGGVEIGSGGIVWHHPKQALRGD